MSLPDPVCSTILIITWSLDYLGVAFVYLEKVHSLGSDVDLLIMKSVAAASKASDISADLCACKIEASTSPYNICSSSIS